jgi:hypothetical protein
MRPLPSLDPHKSRERQNQSLYGCRGSTVFWQLILVSVQFELTFSSGPGEFQMVMWEIRTLGGF